MKLIKIRHRCSRKYDKMTVRCHIQDTLDDICVRAGNGLTQFKIYLEIDQWMQKKIFFLMNEGREDKLILF